ncbi:GspE/PulE family protein [Parasporobacterium paucivorans]|uniref:Type II secretion system protein E (GspE) n=1 Tax=Parasporobacterium paucivorans DSM 15970 TaxID=1122934 RepID=A0A1M6IS73_9FIRM|nr:GspE/PulE family protein [Parasporobacterium paucivorans]SHJ37353.1 type II secretion system protein E (GspE) [Parasporobacterium paucivorans DSM 15970]
MGANHRKLGEILVETGAITAAQRDEALLVSKTNRNVLGTTLVELGYIDEKTLYKGLEYLFHVPYIDLSSILIDKEATSMISEELAKKHNIIPIKKEGKVLTAVMSDPLNFYALDDIRNATGMEISVAISPQKDIASAIDRYYGSEIAEKAFEDLQKEYGKLDVSALSEISESEVANAPVVRLINSMLQHAVKSNASDIHIEPTATKLIVRFRVDGQLQEVMTSSMSAHPAISTRIKIMSDMDIAEKRLPQDGRVETVVDGKNIDLRVSLLPGVYGEIIVIRVLGGQNVILDRRQLGISEANMLLFDKLIKSPNGIILVSGPTGSGKTTTLYTLLKELNKPEVNIITVEDPVEYKLEGINQVQVNVKAGLTFANGLRSILRQDPDIIMIGEIRDSETAEIAIRASITGHLVLSTIHTNDSASSVARLVDMGIEPYLVSSSLVGVVAQRLVRNICPRCKTSYRPSHDEMLMLKMKEPAPLYKGAGCPACNFTGYKGRTGIYEILVVTKEIRELVNRRASIDQIAAMAVRQGATTLQQSCTELVLSGVTTVSELVKVTYSVD